MKHRWLARLLVVALHAALLAALWLQRAAPLPVSGERRTISLRIVTLPATKEPALVPPRIAAPRSVRPTATPPAVAPPVSTSEPAPATASPTAPPAEAPPVEAPRTALRLVLPPAVAASTAAPRNPALSDPRSNTPRLSLEDRIADATGGAGAWVEEPTDNHSLAVGALGDRRTVMRRGNTCVEVFRSRIADSDPFNNSVAPRTVPMLGKPYTCKGPGR